MTRRVARHGRCSMANAPCAGAPMEFLAKLAGKRDVPVAPQVTRYEEFLVSVRVERERLETLVNAIQGDGADAVPRVIARLEERASALTAMLDEVGTRTEQV